MSEKPGWRINEDWLAVVVGLLLFGLTISGVITAGIVP